MIRERSERKQIVALLNTTAFSRVVSGLPGRECSQVVFTPLANAVARSL